jgi:hypothetical protein
VQDDPVVRVLEALERERVRGHKDRMDAEALRRKFGLEDD